MAVDTCRGEKPQSHQPKMLEDGKKAALIGGVIVHFSIGPWCSPALRLGGGYPVTFVCGQGKVRFCYPSLVSLVNSCSDFCDKSLLYSSMCLMGSVAERSKALV